MKGGIDRSNSFNFSRNQSLCTFQTYYSKDSLQLLRVIVEDALVVELVPKPLIFINFDSLFVSFFLNREYFLEKLMTYRVCQRVFLVKKKRQFNFYLSKKRFLSGVDRSFFLF